MDICTKILPSSHKDIKIGVYRSPESIPHMTSIISQTSEYDEHYDYDGTSRTDRTHLFDIRLCSLTNQWIAYNLPVDIINAQVLSLFILRPFICVYAPVPLCRIYSWTRTNVRNFQIHANSCWGKDESCKFFIWAWFFLDNSKIKMRHVRSQVDKVRLYLRMTINEHAK